MTEFRKDIMTPEQIQARNNELESNNRLLVERLQKAKKEFKLQKEKIKNLEQDIEDLKECVEVKRCDSCKHLIKEDLISEIGSEDICYVCKENGYGL